MAVQVEEGRTALRREFSTTSGLRSVEDIGVWVYCSYVESIADRFDSSFMKRTPQADAADDVVHGIDRLMTELETSQEIPVHHHRRFIMANLLPSKRWVHMHVHAYLHACTHVHTHTHACTHTRMLRPRAPPKV